MQQLELFPELDVNHHTVVFTFEGVDYVTEPAEMEVIWEDEEPRGNCEGCAFFTEPGTYQKGCQESEKVHSCITNNIIWVKKG